MKVKFLFILLLSAIWGWGQDTYTLVTSESEIESGGIYLIGNGASGTVKFLSYQNTNNRGTSNDYTVTSGSVSVTPGTFNSHTTLPFEITLSVSNDFWILNDAVNNSKLGPSKGNNTNNHLKASTNSPTYTISIDFSNKATITCVGSEINTNGRNIIRFNSSSSPQLFSSYASGQSDVYLYKKQVSGNTVTFHANGGTGSMSPQTSAGPANLTANAFTRTGYSFTNWNTQADGSGASYLDQANYDFSANMDLYAQWAINAYTLAYAGNGSDGGTVNTGGSYNYNSSITLPTPTMTKTGHTFSGWNTLANGTGINYLAGATYTMPAANTTLYAKWTPNNYDVIFDKNNASATGSMSNQTFAYGSSANLTANAYSLTGYTFVGWTTAADGTGTLYADAASYTMNSTGNVTLYAKWEVYVAPVAKTYKLVTSTADLVVGKKYLITNSATAGSSKALSSQKTNNRDQADITIVTGSPNTITVVPASSPSGTEPYELTLGGSTGAWTFYDEVNGGFLHPVSGNNYLKNATGGSNNYQWSISIASNVATIATTTDNRTIRYNIGSSIFSAYTSGQNNVYLFVEVNTTPEPEINLKQASTNIASGTGEYDFGNQQVSTSSSAVTFTIENTGTEDLLLNGTPDKIQKSGTNPGDFTIVQTSTVSPVSPSGSTTFTIEFSPSASGMRTATISIPNNDSDENPYTFTVKGNGTYATTSTITENSTNYNNGTPGTKIEYTSYQATPAVGGDVTGTIGVMKFRINDAGGDGQPTILTDLKFTVKDTDGTNQINQIRHAVLATTGNSIKAVATITGTEIVFSGLSAADFTAADGSNLEYILRVSYKSDNNIVDNAKFVFKVSSATANSSGSVFGSADAGGATTDTSGDNKNRINVTATQINFVQQPTNTGINATMTPSVTVSANDANGNRDKDFTGLVQITSDGTMTGDPISLNAVNGLATFGSIVHTATGTGLKLTATSGAWSSIISDAFNISEIVYTNNDYRTKTGGTWSTQNTSTSTWEKYNELTNNWVDSGRPTQNTHNVFIRHTITSNGNSSVNNLTIEEGGSFTSTHQMTINGNLLIKSNGLYSQGAAINLQTTSNFEIEDNGTFKFSNTNANPQLFVGIEKFHPESNFHIVNFGDVAIIHPTDNREVTANTYFNPNTNSNYTALFGNLYYESSNARTIITNVGAPSFNLTHRNLEINSEGEDTNPIGNNSNKRIILIQGEQTIGIGGNVIVKDGYFVFTNGSSANQTVNIEGDLILEGNNGGTAVIQHQANSQTSTVNLKGNLKVSGNTRLGSIDASNTFLNFNRNYTTNGEQTIEFNSTHTTEPNLKLTFTVDNGSYTKLKKYNFPLGSSSSVKVLSGGILDFGFADDNSTPLQISKFDSQTSMSFTAESGSTLKITSPDGITATANLGNVQTPVAGRTFDGNATYHYIGKANQVSGNGLPSAASDKKVIVELADDSLTFQPNGLNKINSGGYLEIRKGIVYDNATGSFADGDDAITDPTKRGGLIMSGGRYILNKTGTQPGLSGTYDLSAGVVEFANNGATDQTIRNTPTYKYQNIEITGSNVGASSGNTALRPNGTFTVKNNGVFTVRQNSIRCYNPTLGDTGAGTNCAVTVENGGTFRTNNDKGFSGYNSDFGTFSSAIDANITNITLEPTSTVEYLGETSSKVQEISRTILVNGIDHYANLKISGQYVQEVTGELKVANKVIVDEHANGATTHKGKLVVANTTDEVAANALYARKGVQIFNDTDLILKNNAVLLQDEDAVNEGKIKVEKQYVFSAGRKQYNFVSVPVKYFKLKEGSNQDNWFYKGMTYVLKYNEATDYFVNASLSDQTITGKGFAIKEASVGNANDGLGVFTGVPFNGSTSIQLDKNGQGFNVIGNPYPSTLDLVQFYNDNSANIGSTFWFWDNRGNTVFEQHGAQYTTLYTDHSYAAFNVTHPAGGSGTPAPSAGDSNKIPSQYVRPGAGFMVQAGNAAKVNFNHSQRGNGVAPNFTGKMTQGNQLTQTNQDIDGIDNGFGRYWLEMKAPVGLTYSTVIAYFEGGDNAYAKDDSDAFGSSDELYFTLADKQIIIQGKQAFVNTDVVPMGYRAFERGTYSINLGKKEGVFANGQKIYLKDKDLGVIHDLTQGAYNFKTQKGEFNNRFEIVYKPNKKASLNSLAEVANVVHVQKVNQQIEVTSTVDKISEVEIFNLSGRSIVKAKNIHELNWTMPTQTIDKQILVVVVKTETGEVVTKKVITK